MSPLEEFVRCSGLSISHKPEIINKFQEKNIFRKNNRFKIFLQKPKMFNWKGWWCVTQLNTCISLFVSSLLDWEWNIPASMSRALREMTWSSMSDSSGDTTSVNPTTNTRDVSWLLLQHKHDESDSYNDNNRVMLSLLYQHQLNLP